MSTSTLTSPYKVAPLRGGQINNDTSFTGGIPVLDGNKVFSSTTTTSSGPPSFMSIRTHDVSNMMKVELGAKKAPSIIFTSATDASYGLMTYTGVVHRHFIEYGMDAIFYFTTHDGSLVSILEGHSQFTREEVSKQSAELYKNRDNTSKTLPLEKYDMYDIQNLRFSAAFILASISPALRAQVLTKAGKDYDNGPIVWMFVMGLVQSSSYRGTKILQRTFEERKLKSEPGEDVIKHTIKLRDDYMRLYNANMVPYDALMTVIDSLIDSSTPTFAVWAATKRIAVSRFLKNNAGKTPSALSLMTDAPTVETICDEADDEYQSLLEAGLWVAIDSKKDKDATPTAFLLEKLSSKVDKLSANLTKREGTCWTCGKEGHKSPECPTKNNNSSDISKKKSKDHNKKPIARAPRPEWKGTAPKSGESESVVRNNRTWLWCNICKHWSTTHGTSTHKGSNASNAKDKTSKSPEKSEEHQGNLAEIVMENNNSNELVLGAWCGFTTESTNTMAIPMCSSTPEATDTLTIPDSTPDTLMPVLSCLSKENNTTDILHNIGIDNNGGSYCTDPSTEKSTWIQASKKEKCFAEKSDCTTAIVTMTTPPPIKSIHYGLPALVTPMSDPFWIQSCLYQEIDPGVSYSSNMTTENDTFKVIWDTGASEVITSDPTDFIGGYDRPKSPLQLRGVSSGTTVAGIGLVEYCFRANDHSILTVRMKAYYMPGSLPSNIKLLPPQRLCLVTGGDFVTTGTTATLRLPNKPHLTMELDPSSNLPFCTATKSSTVLAQGHQVNLCVTAESNQNLTTSQKLLLTWHFRFGHLNFSTVQWILRSGIFGKNSIFSAAGKCDHPKCAACEYGKARRQPTKSTIRKPVPERENALKGNILFPGQRVSLDHFVCSAKGRLSFSKGKTPLENMYCGGAIFVDQASGYIFIQSQVTFSSVETLQAKLTFEQMCLSNGVSVVTYMSDNGTAFRSKEFVGDIISRGQDARYSAIGAHHHNGIAERAIMTISNMSRTMMIHAAVRWPDMADSSLWPLAMEYAAYIYNHTPKMESGVAPIDIFTRTTVPRQRLKDLHVWGCPTYVLEPKLQDGKKIPRWKPRSRRGVFLGFGDKYASSVPLVLNPATSHISPQFHVIFDDLFSTVISQLESDEPPLEWNDLCVTSRYQTNFDDNDPVRLHDDWLTTDELALRRHQDSQSRIISPPVSYTNRELPITQAVEASPQTLTDPPEQQRKEPPEPQREQTQLQREQTQPEREQPQLQREQPQLQREQLQTLTLPTTTSIPQIPAEHTLATASTRPTRIHRRPSRFDAFDVKYGTLSAISAYFALLPDILREPTEQKEFELDALEAMLQQVTSTDKMLTIQPFAFTASKSDPDTLMYHEAMMADDKQDF